MEKMFITIAIVLGLINGYFLREIYSRVNYDEEIIKMIVDILKRANKGNHNSK